MSALLLLVAAGGCRFGFELIGSDASGVRGEDVRGGGVGGQGGESPLPGVGGQPSAGGQNSQGGEGGEPGPSVCGDGVRDSDESCDAGALNGIYFGDGSGCTKFCTSEPNCRGTGTSGCVSVCGDGLIMAPEECDDGNASNGDGCSTSCAVESGFVCETETLTNTEPCSYDGTKECLVLPVVYRDFIAAGFPGGHDDFLYAGNLRSNGEVVTDDLNGSCRDMVDVALGGDGKPRLRSDYAGCAGDFSVFSAASFLGWYATAHSASRTHVRTLEMEQQVGSNSFQFSSSELFPLDGMEQDGELQYCDDDLYQDYQPHGVAECTADTHNYHFTSEVRYVFRYQGGEELSFRGDDDVYVFVAESKALDLGGVHLPQTGSVELDDQGLTVGRVYEIAVFHAERKPKGSNYRLTLSGFEAERTVGCSPAP